MCSPRSSGEIPEFVLSASQGVSTLGSSPVSELLTLVAEMREDFERERQMALDREVRYLLKIDELSSEVRPLSMSLKRIHENDAAREQLYLKKVHQLSSQLGEVVCSSAKILNCERA